MSIFVSVIFPKTYTGEKKITVWSDKGKVLNKLSNPNKFVDWVKLLQINLQSLHVIEEECVYINTSYGDRIIEESLYWNEEEIPQGAVKCKGVYSEQVVTVYVSFKEGTTCIHYPNPLSPIWHMAVQEDELNSFIKQHGYLIQ
ncbi:hypothetical protein, partial [Bacillus thuringiensis]